MTVAILITLLAELMYSSTNYIDKFLVNGVNESGSNIKTLIVFSTLIAGLVFSPIWIIVNGFNFSIGLIPFICMFTSTILTTSALYFYFKSLELSDTSVVVVMFQLIPVFSYILGFIFFKETLTVRQIIGSIIIICSTLLISIDTKNKHKSNFKTFIFMSLSSLFYSVYYILFEIAVRNSSYNICALYFQLSLILLGLIFMCIKSFRNTFIKAIMNNGKKYLSLNIINEVTN